MKKLSQLLDFPRQHLLRLVHHLARCLVAYCLSLPTVMDAPREEGVSSVLFVAESPALNGKYWELNKYLLNE